jgi:hypothetical protein
MSGERKKLQVLVVTEREFNGEKKTFWTRVGSAFENKDGSITCLLDALPVSGKLQIREDDRDSKRGGGGGDAPF